MNKIISFTKNPIKLGLFIRQLKKPIYCQFSIQINKYINTIPLERKKLQGLSPLTDLEHGSEIIGKIYKLPTQNFLSDYKLKQKDDITQFMIKTIDLVNRINRDKEKTIAVSNEIRTICAKLISMDRNDPYINNFINTLGVLAAKQYRGGRINKTNLKLLIWVLSESSDMALHCFFKELFNIKINEDAELERLALVFLQVFDHPELFIPNRKTIDLLCDNVSVVFEKHKNDTLISITRFSYLKKTLMGLFKVRQRDQMVKKLVLYLLMKDAGEIDESFLSTVVYIFCKEDIAKSFKYDVINVNPRLLEYMRQILYDYGYKEGADLYFNEDMVKIDKLPIFFEAFILKLLDTNLDNELVHLLYALVESKNYSEPWITKVNAKLKYHIVHSNLSPQTHFILLYIFYMQPILDSDSYLSIFIFKTFLANKHRFDVVTEIEHYMGFLTLRRFKHYLEKYFIKNKDEEYDETKIVIRSFYENLFDVFIKKIDHIDFINLNRILYEIFYNLKTLDFGMYMNLPIQKALWSNCHLKITELSNFDFITVVYVLKRFFSLSESNKDTWVLIINEIAKRKPQFNDYQKGRMIIAIDNIKEFLSKSVKIKAELKNTVTDLLDKARNTLKSN